MHFGVHWFRIEMFIYSIIDLLIVGGLGSKSAGQIGLVGLVLKLASLKSIFITNKLDVSHLFSLSADQEMSVLLSKSKAKGKKFSVFVDGKIINFGAEGYSDYTIHKDDERKNRYIQRHKTREDWNNRKSAGFWSRWILWNKKTLAASIKDTEAKFNFKIQRE